MIYFFLALTYILLSALEGGDLEVRIWDLLEFFFFLGECSIRLEHCLEGANWKKYIRGLEWMQIDI